MSSRQVCVIIKRKERFSLEIMDEKLAAESSVREGDAGQRQQPSGKSPRHAKSRTATRRQGAGTQTSTRRRSSGKRAQLLDTVRRHYRGSMLDQVGGHSHRNRRETNQMLGRVQHDVDDYVRHFLGRHRSKCQRVMGEGGADEGDGQQRRAGGEPTPEMRLAKRQRADQVGRDCETSEQEAEEQRADSVWVAVSYGRRRVRHFGSEAASGSSGASTTSLDEVPICDGGAAELIRSAGKTLPANSSADQMMYANSQGSAAARPKRVVAQNALTSRQNGRAKKSVAAYFRESLYFKKPSWQTGLAGDDMSESLGADNDKRHAELGGQNGSKTGQVSENDDNDQVLEHLNKQATESFGSKTFKYDNTSKTTEFLAGSRPCKQLERQSQAISSSYELASQRALVLSTDQQFVGKSGANDSSASTADEQGPRNAARSCAPTRKRPKIGHLPAPSNGLSLSFGTTTSTDRASSAFSDSYDAISGISRVKLAPHGANLTGRTNPSGRSVRVAMENLKFILERNLVATLVGVYILISLAVIIVLMLPYLFDFQRRPPPVSEQGTDTGEPGLHLVAQAVHQHRLELARESKATQTEHKDWRQPAPGPQLADRDKDEAGRALLQAAGSDPEGHQSKLAIGAKDDQEADGRAQADQRQLEEAKQDRKQRFLARLNQIRAEARARESEDFRKLWRVVHRRQCQPMKVPFCSRTVESMLSASSVASQRPEAQASLQDLSYDKTLLPNQFTLARQSHVERVLEKYEPLVDVRCYSLMPLFLCTIYAPKCVQVNASALVSGQLLQSADSTLDLSMGQAPDVKTAADFVDRLFPLPRPVPVNRTTSETQWARLVPPCRSVCKEAFRKCTFFLEVLSLKLFNPEECDSLPESADDNVCVGQRENILLQKRTENQKCRDEEFKCTGGECIPKKWRCDGFADCEDKSDEEKCSRCDVASQFYCGQDVCINKRQVCDGRIDCKDGRDERLCLRLANTTMSIKRGLRTLEAWNSSIASWVPVCGANWQAVPMSHEACQALGYSRANETLILFGREEAPPGGAIKSQARSHRTTLADALVPLMNRTEQTNYTDSIGTRTLTFAATVQSMRSDHLVDYERQIPLASDITPSDLVQPNGSGTLKLNSLARFLNLGAQTGCSDKPAHLASTVHLQCHEFQCGRSITSYLSRLDAHQQFATAGTTKVATVSDADLIRMSELDTKGPSGAGSQLAAGLRSSIGSPRQRRPPTLATDDDDDDDLVDQIEGALDDEHGPQRYPVSLSSSGTNSPISSRLVVGGIESMPGEFPYLAALHGGPDEVFFCGGVLININWLLTAAHCVGNRTQPDGWMVKVGVTRRIASPAFVRKLKVKKIIKHFAFNHGTHLNNDIALILLEESVEFNQYLRPICLPAANLRLGPDNSKDCVVVGFGKSRFSQDANYLQVAHFVNVPIIHRSVCSSWYAEQEVNLTDGMLCAGYSEGKRDACQGDSGSGLFCRYSNTNQFFVAGVVSFGIKCATPRLPGVYTSVPYYVNWIKNTTREFGHPIS